MESPCKTNDVQAPAENGEASLLKAMRENKSITQLELANSLRLSRDQIRSIENENTWQTLLKVQLFIKALGYRFRDFVDLIEVGWKDQPFDEIYKGSLEEPASRTYFGEGITVLTYLKEKNGNFIGQIQLDPGKSLKKGGFPTEDLVFGMVLEGTLGIDFFGIKERLYKQRQFFIFDGQMPFEFFNLGSPNKASSLIVSVKYPQKL